MDRVFRAIGSQLFESFIKPISKVPANANGCASLREARFRIPMAWAFLKRVLGVLPLALLLGAPGKSHAAEPGIAGTASLIPGLGQALNGDHLEGGAWLATVVGGMLHFNPNVRQAAFDLWMYNMYDAYRDAGAKDTTKYNVYQNYLATFNPLNIIDPIGASLVGVQAIGVHRRGRGGYQVTAPRNPILVPVSMGFVGLGEEALFRGFLFPGFSHLTGSRWAGAITSSALFSAAHMIDGTAASRSFLVLGSRFLAGMLFCWQTHRNAYDLRKSIFAHAWFDVLAIWDEQHVFPRVNAPSVLPSSSAPSAWKPSALGLKMTLPF
ncbi:MAG: CPBP family intramembrane glutamic endopeptidase [Bdellovibrionota bacterium]